MNALEDRFRQLIYEWIGGKPEGLNTTFAGGGSPETWFSRGEPDADRRKQARTIREPDWIT